MELLRLALIDKSALARMTHPRVQDRIAPILEAGTAATCSIVDLEVLYSVRGSAEHEMTRQRRELAYEHIPIDESVFARAIEVQGLLAKEGQHRLPIPDLLVAAAAELGNASVLHYDKHFDQIAAITRQPVEWVVPQGTV